MATKGVTRSMRLDAIRLTVLAGCTAALVGQTPPQTAERRFRLTQVAGERSVQEIATVVRSIADIGQLATDPSNRSVTVSGTAGQIALAEWLLVELDQPANPAAGADPTRREYRVPGEDEIVRVFYLGVTSPRQIQEIATNARSLADVRRVFVYNQARALVLRGPADRIAMAEWLIRELDQPEQPTGRHRTNEYRAAGGVDDAARLFYLAPAATPQQLQEVATILRSTADIRRVFTYAASNAIAVRGTSNEVTMAEWLFHELHHPAGRQYSFPPSADDYTRVLRLTPATTPNELQETAVLVRKSSGLKRVFTYLPQRAIVVRGASSQLATAERLVLERIGR